MKFPTHFLLSRFTDKKLSRLVMCNRYNKSNVITPQTSISLESFRVRPVLCSRGRMALTQISSDIALALELLREDL